MTLKDRAPGSFSPLFPVLFAACLCASLEMYLTPSRATGCLEYGEHIRWVGGAVPILYVPGDHPLSIDVARERNYAYLANTEGLYRYDVTNPAAPVRMEWVDLYARKLGAAPYRVCALRDRDLVIMNSTNGLMIVGTVALDSPCAVRVSNPYAYVANGAAGLAVVRVTGFGPPAVVGIATGMGVVGNVAVGTSRAYALSSSGLWVVDITDPSHPLVVGNAFPNPGHLVDLVMGGDGYLYVTDHAFGLRVFDLNNPDLPVQVGTLAVEWAGVVAAGNGRVVLPRTDLGILHDVDVTDPAHPRIVGAYREPSHISGLLLEGSVAYISSENYGLQIFDFEFPTNPAELALVVDGQSGRDLSRIGDHVALLTQSALQIYDVTEPLAPVRVFTYPIPYAEAMEVAGTRAYILGYQTLYIIDLSVPAQPTLLGTASVSGDDISVSSDRAFVKGYDGPFYIYDVADPTNVVLLGTGGYGFVDLDSPGPEVLYTVDAPFYAGSQLYKWDVSDPANPSLEDYEYTDLSAGVICSGDRVYTVGLSVVAFDANTLAPEGRVGTHWFGRTGSISQDRLYVKDSDVFHVFELAETPRYLGSGLTEPPGEWWEGGILEVDGYLYVTDGSGIHIYPRACAASGIDVAEGIPARTSIENVGPNPFTNQTQIRIHMAQPEVLDLSIYDAAGRMVRSLLANQTCPTGKLELSWDGRDTRNLSLPAGVYFLRLSVGGSEVSRRLQRVR